jgi:hypothetical protein
VAPVDRSASVVAGQSFTFDPLTGASDVEGDPLTVHWVSQPEHGSLVANVDGSYTYTADADYKGADSLSWHVNDGDLDSANTTTLSLMVLPAQVANTAPVAQDASVSLDEDGELLIDLTAWASDAEGEPLQATITTQPVQGTLVQLPGGRWLYTPVPDFNGNDSFTYRVNDGQADSNIATISLTVHPVNDAPVARDVTLTLDEDTALRFGPLAGASDVDGDALSIQIIDGPTHGALTVNADGSFTYTPQADYFGSDAFSYRVSDGQSSSSLAWFHIEVAAVNDAPTATGGLVTGVEDTPLILRWSDFAVQDIDDTALTLTLTDLPTDGRLELRNAQGVWQAVTVGTQLVQAQLDAGLLSFVPAADASGGPGYTQTGYGNRMAHYARLAYMVSDGHLSSAEAVMEIDIAPVVDSPPLELEEPRQNPPATPRELLRTDWENISPSQLPSVTTLDGWALLKADDSPKSANSGIDIIERNDSAWLELKVAGNSPHQTVGIERTVNTEAGATYTLSFDLAGSPASATDYLFVYVDGVKLSISAGISLGKAQDGQTVSYQYTGTGQPQSIRIVYEPSPEHLNGHSVMIDDIVLAETIKQGQKEGMVSLPTIHAALADTDGSETLTLTLAGLPVGSTLTDGQHSVTVTAENPLVDLIGWDTAVLLLQPPAGFSGALSLEVRATATETATGEQATVTRALNVNVVDATTAAPVSESFNVALNPYVTLIAPASDAEAPAMTSEIVVGPLTPDTTGVGQFSVAPYRREDEDEEQAPVEVSEDEWMLQLEQTAKAQWVQLMRG